MKNIHVLPTDKRSILSDCENYKHVYITSDEEIKEGDWCYQVELNDGKIDKCYDVTLYHTWTNNGVDKKIKYKKIILTTDQDLINDGVQAIDDTFLEWFVKNPSCEEVEIELFPKFSNNLYGIIIPQEEPKQEPLSFPPFDKEKADVITKEGQKVIRELRSNIQQETIEEAAELYEKTRVAHDELYIESNDIEDLKASYYYKGRRDECIKWQAERMYSEEDIMKAMHSVELKYNRDLTKVYEGMKEWFEQFKNKGGDK
jgi:hypothetical protein